MLPSHFVVYLFKKKIGRPLQGVLMGEEKPDEELMGKRK